MNIVLNSTTLSVVEVVAAVLTYRREDTHPLSYSLNREASNTHIRLGDGNELTLTKLFMYNIPNTGLLHYYRNAR